MHAKNLSNGSYEKVSLLDEFDENENFFNNAPIVEAKTNASNTYKFEDSVSITSFKLHNNYSILATTVKGVISFFMIII